VAVVIVIIPIAIGVPAVAILIPPAMALVPATFARFVQFVPRTIGLPAFPAVMLDGFVQPVIRLGDAPLATAVVIRARTRRPGKDREANKRSRNKHGLSEKLSLSRVKFHVLSILSFSPLAGMG
jgi:hypothetical protein